MPHKVLNAKLLHICLEAALAALSLSFCLKYPVVGRFVSGNGAGRTGQAGG
jgi:hypothetical protein